MIRSIPFGIVSKWFYLLNYSGKTTALCLVNTPRQLTAVKTHSSTRVETTVVAISCSFNID